nr:immunoglobulin light chain junction region [Macaca mulatta]
DYYCVIWYKNSNWVF